jgi:hypothetical protein
MILFFLHSGFMATGLLLILSGFIIVRFMKSKRWWLKAHKGLETTGAVCIGLGLGVAFFMVARNHHPHFSSPHTYLGAITIFLSILTVTLGYSIFRSKPWAPKLRAGHHWSGRTTLLLAGLTAFSGMVLAGIL